MIKLNNNYNSLYIVEHANDLLKESKVKIEDLANLFLSYGVENIYGICLLHKHYDIFENEIVIQKGLVTSPTTENNINKIPNMIKLYENGEYEILEYTESNEKFIYNNDFLKNFYDLINEKKLNNILGITTINNKDGYYLEHTEGRSNILTPITEEEIKKNNTNIPTNWFFNSPVYDACISSYQCRRTTVCNVFCRSTPRRGHTSSAHNQKTGNHNSSRTGHQRA